MTGLIIIILLIFGIPYIWRWLRPYFLRWVQHRAENYFRKAMGVPPREKRQSDRKNHRQSTNSSSGYQRYSGRHKANNGPVIPKEYAEDVEFTEVRSYSEEHTIANGGSVAYTSESQVSDAEIIEIKKDK